MNGTSYTVCYVLGVVFFWEDWGPLAIVWPLLSILVAGVVLAGACLAIHRAAEVLYGLKNWNDP